MSMSRTPDPPSWPTTARATTRLRRLVTRPEIAFLMEAHNGLSARIVEEAGFEGIWASGLTVSTSFGVRDNNELSWTQVVVAGVVIEDKLFPKTNSFIRSELQPLADIDEFSGKIKAGRDSQTDPD